MTEENNAVTNFLDKYKYIIGVIIIIFLLVLAFIFISSQAKANKIEEASKLYYNWNLNVLNDNIEKSDEYLNELLNDYEDTGYAKLALLQDSTKEFEQGNEDTSLNQLLRLKDLTAGPRGNKLLHKIASINIARINIDQAEYDNAISILTSLPNSSQDAFVTELMGDIYLKQGNTSESRAQYLSAAEMYADENNEVGQRLVRMKIANLK